MKSRFFPMVVALTLVFSLLAACSSSSSLKPVESTRGAAPPGAPEFADKGATADAVRSQSGAAQVSPVDRMIVYTANLNMDVKDVEQSIEAVTQIVELAGGVVAGTRLDAEISQKDKQETRTAYMSLRVPSDKYADVMMRLRKLAVKPPKEDSSSQDVTEEFADLQAQLRNLEVVEAQYQELMKKAVTIDEILKVQQKLGETRGQIERVKGRMIYLQRRADMAIVNVYLRPEVPGKDGKTGAWDPAKVASESWNASMVFLQAVASVVITVMVFFWWLFPLLAMAVIAWFIWRGRRRPAVTAGA